MTTFRSQTGRSLPCVFSMGDPNGVGPEVLLKALARTLDSVAIHPILFGDSKFLSRLRVDLGLPEALDQLEIIQVTDVPYPPPYGAVTREAGQASVASLKASLEYCRANRSPLLVTAPVSKKSMHLAGTETPGQTELIASYFPAGNPAMAFFSDSFQVLLVTAHVPLVQVPSLLTREVLVQKTALFVETLERLGMQPVRLAVCGLNPHASEQGLLGDEEEKIIAPGVEALQRRFRNHRIEGPLSPDTVFRRAYLGEFQAVVALYHDQGLIPLKMVAFDSAVNTTLGLPLIRVSPDHGTAFDLAGRNEAQSSSMVSAIEWGVRLAQSAPTIE